MDSDIEYDIKWFRNRILYYMGEYSHRDNTLIDLSRSNEMKNIISSYGKERLYKEDIENIIRIAEMMV